MATKKMTATELERYRKTKGIVKRAASAKKKRLTRQESEARKWGPSGRARCSAFFVENVTKERDEVVAKLREVQHKMSEMAGQINVIAEFVYVMRQEKVPTNRLINAVLNGQRILDAFNK